MTQTREHENWGSRMSRGTFKYEDWANAIKRDIAAFTKADEALRKEADENEGADPMSDEYKSLDFERTKAVSNVQRHLDHDILVVIADFVLTHSKKKKPTP
jgi:hypothetical protein